MDPSEQQHPEEVDEILMLSEEDVLEEYEVGDAPPPDLASDDDDDDDDDDNDDGLAALPPGTRFVAEYENGEMEEIGGMEDADASPPPPDMAVQTFEGHTGPIYAVAIHPQNPQLMLTGGGDDRAFFWQANPSPNSSSSSAAGTENVVTESANHGDSVNAVGFSSDGTLAATGAYSGKILVWDAATRALLRTLEGPEDVEWMDWHPKGNLLLAGSKDTTIWMWLAVTGDCVKVFTGHEEGVTCGGFTSDGKLIVSGSSDGSVRVWGPKLGICKHVFSGYGFHEGPITALASHPVDGAMLLSGGMDGTARLLHVTNKKVLATMVHSEPKAVEEGDVAPMEEDEDQMQEEDEEEEGGKKQQEGNYSVETVGFSAVLNWCATGGMDGTLKIWDLGNYSCRHVCAHEGAPGVTKLRWHATLPLVYTAATDGVIRLWDARSGALLQALTGHEDMILDFALHCGGVRGGGGGGGPDVVLTGSDDGKAKVFVVDVVQQA